jgi:hypothetical protein
MEIIKKAEVKAKAKEEEEEEEERATNLQAT